MRPVDDDHFLAEILSRDTEGEVRGHAAERNLADSLVDYETESPSQELPYWFNAPIQQYRHTDGYWTECRDFCTGKEVEFLVGGAATLGAEGQYDARWTGQVLVQIIEQVEQTHIQLVTTDGEQASNQPIKYVDLRGPGAHFVSPRGTFGVHKLAFPLRYMHHRLVIGNAAVYIDRAQKIIDAVAEGRLEPKPTKFLAAEKEAGRYEDAVPPRVFSYGWDNLGELADRFIERDDDLKFTCYRGPNRISIADRTPDGVAG